jgi:repressor LexA
MILTDPQQRILDYLRTYVAQKGYPPTRQEIANAMGYVSPNAAHEHLLALQRKGCLTITPEISRGIRLTP